MAQLLDLKPFVVDLCSSEALVKDLKAVFAGVGTTKVAN
jgi:hypothetical protein